MYFGEQVKDGIKFDYSDDFNLSENMIVSFFSKKEFSSPKLSRKYKDFISEKRYYKDGRKAWFNHLLKCYEMVIPKSALELNPEKSEFSYTAFDIKGTGVTIVNNTSGFRGCNYQSLKINHCKTISRKEFNALESVAVMQNETKESNEPVYVPNYAMVKFIAKYANGKTNFSKSKIGYSRFMHGLPYAVSEVLSIGDVEKAIEIFEKEDLRTFNMVNVLKDLNDWVLREYDLGKIPVYSLPQDYIEAFNSIKTYNQKAVK